MDTFKSTAKSVKLYLPKAKEETSRAGEKASKMHLPGGRESVLVVPIRKHGPERALLS